MSGKMSKCPYCGANVKFAAEDAFVVCEYCGREMEVPRFTQEEKRLTQAVEEMRSEFESAKEAVLEAIRRAEPSVYLNELKREQQRLSEALNVLIVQQQNSKAASLQHRYELGEAAQRTGNFAEAIRHFQELIVMSEKPEAEVHWRIVLCRYGVEYVREQSSETWLPTIMHMIVDSIEDDASYQAAVRHARSERMRAFYKEEAQRINNILDKYRVVYGREKPYDVFISVKQDDGTGRPTRDSMIAMELYHILKGMGLHVFNSRVSLQEHVGLEYEPYIMAALMTSKMLLLVGTRSDYMNSPWVRNEWRRFRWLQENKKQERYLIPCIVGMAASEVPRNVGAHQMIDASDSEDLKKQVRETAKRIFSIPDPKEDETGTVDNRHFESGELIELRRAAEQGDTEAMKSLGEIYELGRGVPQDLQEAARWYYKAAQLENADAMKNLAWMYDHGKGVARDQKIAVEWYKKAAEAGNVVAMYTLGGRYEKGEGVAKDRKAALYWYERAADAGNSLAKVSYEKLQYAMLPFWMKGLFDRR